MKIQLLGPLGLSFQTWNACHPNQLTGLGAIKSLAQAMPMKPKALKMVMSLLKFLGRDMRCFFFWASLPKKSRASPQKRLLFTTLLSPKKIGFLVSIVAVAAFSKSNVAVWVIPATSGASQMPFDPPIPRIGRIGSLATVVVPTRPSLGPKFLERITKVLKWWFVLEYQRRTGHLVSWN